MLGRKPLGVWLVLALALAAVIGSPTAAKALIPGTADLAVNPTIVSFGAVVPLNINVVANDDAGTNTEYWVVITDPGLNKYSYNGSAWASGTSIMGSGPLADFNTVLYTDPLTAAGNYKVEVLVDFTVNGSIDSSAVYDAVTIQVNALPQVAPTMKVTVNGFDNPTVTINDTTAIRLQMNSGTYTGTLAEWWIIITRPDGGKWYYDSLGAWQLDPMGAPHAPVAYGWNPLIDVDTVIVSPQLSIPGQYTVYWGMDDTYDGNVGLVVWDTATIQVPGNLPTVGISFFGSPTNPVMWPGTVGTPLTVDMILDVDDGDYGSLDAEFWLVCIKPDGSMLYYDNSGPPIWGVPTFKDQDTMANLEFNWDGVMVTSPNMDGYGTWSYYILIDNDQNGAIDTNYFIYDKVQFFVGTDPQVDLHPFQSPWSISGDAPVDLGVWCYVYPGLYGSAMADLWLVAVSPVGVYNSLKKVDGWVPGINYYTQGILDTLKDGVISLPDLNDPTASHDGWNYFEANLHGMLNSMTGTWTVYFGVDPLNGWVDSNIIYKTKTIVIQP